MTERELTGRGVYLGRQGTGNEIAVWCDISAWTRDAAGSGVLMFRAPDGGVWPMHTRVDTERGRMYAVVTATETAQCGNAAIEARWHAGPTVFESECWNAYVMPSELRAEIERDRVTDWVRELILGYNIAANVTDEARAAAREANEALHGVAEAARSAENAAQSERNAHAAMASAGECARDAEAWARGTRDGEAVEEEDEAYRASGRYWAEQAARSAAEAGACRDEAYGCTQEGYDALVADVKNTCAEVNAAMNAVVQTRGEAVDPDGFVSGKRIYCLEGAYGEDPAGGASVWKYYKYTVEPDKDYLVTAFSLYTGAGQIAAAVYFLTEDEQTYLGYAGYDPTHTSRTKGTWAVKTPANCKRIYVNTYRENVPAVREGLYVNSEAGRVDRLREDLGLLSDVGAQVGLNPNYVSIEKDSRGVFTIRLPVRINIYGGVGSNGRNAAARQVTRAGSVDDEFVLNGTGDDAYAYLILNLDDNTVVRTNWGSLGSEYKNYILLAFAAYGDILAGALRYEWNRRRIGDLRAAQERTRPKEIYFADGDRINERARRIRDMARGIERGGTFAFITDAHMGKSAGSSGALLHYLHGRTNALDRIFFGGDVPMQGTWDVTGGEVLEHGDAWLDMMAPVKDRLYQIRGNHDYNAPYTDGAGEPGGFYCDLATLDYYVMKDQRGRVTLPTDSGGEPLPYRLYYYVDTPELRYICLDDYDGNYDYAHPVYRGGFPVRADPADPESAALDPMDETDLESWPASLPPPRALISREQREWIAGAIEGMAPGQTAVIISHQPGGTGGTVFEENTVARIRGAAEGDPDETLEAFLDPYAARIACVLAGHVHRDRSYRTANGLLTVSTAADGMWPGADNYSRGAETVNSACFDVFGIDTANRRITAVRVGPYLTHGDGDERRGPWVGSEGIRQWTY